MNKTLKKRMTEFVQRLNERAEMLRRQEEEYFQSGLYHHSYERGCQAEAFEFISSELIRALNK